MSRATAKKKPAAQRSKLSVDFEPTLKKRLKARAVELETTVKDLVKAYVEQGLDAELVTTAGA